jgi:hypothetical protein
MQGKGYWELPEDLQVIHNAVIEYGVEIHHAAAAKFEKKPESPLSYGALFSLHWRSVVIHRSIRTLCEAGWTPITPILIRTLLDIIASAYAVAAKPEDAEYMGFKFMGSYLIQSIKDPDTSEALREENTKQLASLGQQLRGTDVGRTEELIKNYAPQSYWYRPEYYSPSAILKMAKNDLQFMYRQFSGSAHGGFLGSALFDDSPDMADINPQEHPRRSRSALVASSRLLLDISYIRGQFEGVAEEAKYKHIVTELILPQKAKI